MADDGIEIPIDVHAGDAEDVAKRVAESFRQLREELDKLGKSADKVSGSDSLSRMAKNQTKAYNDATKAVRSQTDAVDKLTRQLIELAAAYAGFRAIKDFIDAGLKFNETIETARLGVASLITSQTDMTTSAGEAVVGTEKLAIAQAFAAEQVDKLRVAGLRSTATTEQLVFAFQQATGVGLRWGLTLDQIRVITVQVAQAAGALGVPLNQLNEEIRSLLTGTITPRNTRIATALGITNAQIKQAQEAGNLFDFVSKRMEAFSVAGEATARTFRGVMSNIREALENFAGDATKPLFETLRLSGQEALEGMFNLDTARISDKLQGILQIVQDIFGDVGDTIAAGISSAVESAQSLSDWLEKNTTEVHKFIGAVEAAAGQVAGLVHDVLSLIPGLAEAGIQAGVLKNIFYGIGLVVADLRTLFDAIVTVLGFIGVIALKAVVTPFTLMGRLIAKIVSLFNEDMANSITKAADATDNWIGGLADNVKAYSQNLEVGNTATERFSDHVKQLESDAEGATKAQKDLRDALENASTFETTVSGLLDRDLENHVITQAEFAKRSKELQLIVVGKQLEAQQTYLNSLSAENEGDRARTRTLINELIKRKSALQRDVKLSPIAPPPADKNTASKAASGETALIKAELANRLKDLKIALDNEKLSYHEYYAEVTKAQQDADDKMIAVQKRLLGATTDQGARSKILDQIKILEANKLQVVEDNNEKERKDELKLAQDVTAIHVQLLKDQGRLSDARALEIGDKYKKLIARLKAEGDEAGAEIVAKLFSIDDAKTRLDELMNQAKTVQEVLSTRLDEIQVESATHAINERQAREGIVQAYKDATTQLEAMLPSMRQAAALTEDPAQIAAVDALATKIKQMNLTVRQQTDDWFNLKEGAREALRSGLVEFIDQAAESAKGFADVWRSVAADIVASLRHIAAQMLANLIMQKSLQYFGAAAGFIGGLFGGGGTTGTVVNPVAGVLAASGGYISGPGTSTSDSIPARLSNGEYVIRAEAVRAVGVDLLHAINEAGSLNMMPRRRVRGYAEGGLVSPAGSSTGGFDATIGLEEGLVARHIRTRPGTDAILHVLAANRNSVRRIMGG